MSENIKAQLRQEIIDSDILIEEAAYLGLQAETLGGALLISKEMMVYTQQRRDQFAAKGTRQAGQ